MGTRILIIKLGALGDVLRTTPLLPALRNAFPECHITWVTERESLPLLAGNPNVNRVLPLEYAACLPLGAEEFDWVLSLDKDPAGAALASMVKAKGKRGFGWNAQGELCPLDEKAEFAYRLGIDNELKFKTNQKTYQQINSEMCDLAYSQEEYQWEVPAEDIQHGKWWAKGTGLDKRRATIGLNTGGGEKFAGKGWNPDHWNNLIHLLQDWDANIVLLGGPREVESNMEIFRRHRGRGGLHNSGTNNTVGQFAGVVDLCDLVVTGDTFGMHVAIARKKKVVALFGSTCPQEIELYGRGIKLYPTDLPCSPCYKKVCDHTVHEDCLRRILVEQVMKGIQELMPLQPIKKEQQMAAAARAKDSEAMERRQARFEEAPGLREGRDNEEDAPVSKPQGPNDNAQRPQGPRHDRRRDSGWRRFRGRNFSPSGKPSSPRPPAP